MKKTMLAAGLLLLVSHATAFAAATIPTKDIAGASDNALVKRYDGSYIVSYERQAFTEFKVPLSTLEATDKKDGKNNKMFLPKKEIELEGVKTRIVYVLPAERSPLEVVRNYEDDVKGAGGQILFSCKGAECGGEPTRASSGGGGNTSLTMYFFDDSRIKDAAYSNGYCAVTSDIDDQRFFAAKFTGDAYVTVQTYQLKDEDTCKAFNGRTIAVVHFLEPKARDQKMVVVKAADMAKSIESAGHIALYGIFFDTDKADLKPESGPTLAEIAQLLKSNPKLSVLIVGHTDNQGGYDYNLDLSRRRADSVVKTLTASHGVDAKRLRGAGVGMLAPSASNDNDEGRARNRRVEIVKL